MSLGGLEGARYERTTPQTVWEPGRPIQLGRSTSPVRAVYRARVLLAPPLQAKSCNFCKRQNMVGLVPAVHDNSYKRQNTWGHVVLSLGVSRPAPTAPPRPTTGASISRAGRPQLPSS